MYSWKLELGILAGRMHSLGVTWGPGSDGLNADVGQKTLLNRDVVAICHEKLEMFA